MRDERIFRSSIWGIALNLERLRLRRLLLRESNKRCLYDTARSRIVLFYAGAKSDEELKELLPAYIPHYMIPNRFVKMDEIPLNMNGKLDRVWLKSQL